MSIAPRPLIHTTQACLLLSRGIDTLTAPLAQTLGPVKNIVVHGSASRSIEFLDDSSTIARRVIRVPGRSANMGAMLLRAMALELHERYGDGAATAAVMTRAMVQEGCRMITAGAHPVRMLRGVKLAIDAVEAELAAQARPVASIDEVTALANGVTRDAELSAIIGNMFDVMGKHATIITQDTPAPYLDYEYIKGGKWDGYIPSRLLIPEGSAGLVLQNPLLLLASEDLTTVEHVQPALELALAQPGKPPLLILARGISDSALDMLIMNHLRGVLTVGLFVLSSGRMVLDQDLGDIAALTGGQVLSEVIGYPVQSIQPHFFGRARRVVLTANGVTIADGMGEHKAIRQRIAAVQAELKQASRADNSIWDFLRIRLARLSGGIGVLKLAAGTDQELETTKELINKTLRVLEAAYDGGLVPGGGAAFLACIPALNKVREGCEHEDERFGVMAVEAALKAPFLQIVRNHGQIHPPLALDAVQRAGSGYGFDALKGDYALMADRHILDSLKVTRGILHAATSTASMIMTTDSIIFSS